MSDNKKNNFKIRDMMARDNESVAFLVRYNLKKHGLDIPGTVYFDSVVDNLYEYYSQFKDCAELQKLYLSDSVKGNGLGYELINYVEKKMIEKGYKYSYLETHDNLKAAIHIYEKSGYLRIDKPDSVMHGAMNVFFYKSLDLK